MKESDAPFDRWHKKYPKSGDTPCRCGTQRNPLYPSADHGRGKRWQARYVGPDGKSHRPVFDSREQARAHLEQVRHALQEDTWEQETSGTKKLEFYSSEFISRRRKKNKRESTTETYETHLRIHILPYAGCRVAKALRRKDTMALVDHLLDKGTIAPGYIVQIFKTWRILMNYLIDEDVPLPANICARIELPEVEPRVKVVLTAEQVCRLAAAMRQVEPRYELLIWIAACAGLREGEAFGLTHDAVGWETDVLYVEEQRQKGKAVPLKTKSSRATLPVDHFLIERIVEHVRRIPRMRPVSRNAELKRQRRGWIPPTDEGLIVTNRDGRPVQRSDFNEKFRMAVVLADLPPETWFHDLKHWYTTRLGASGKFDPKTVQALSRHAEFSETWDTYAHPPLAVQGVKVEAFSELFTAETGFDERQANHARRLTSTAPDVPHSLPTRG
ncbi:tyrosine-type recombinase/integrase [Streptomyces sp. PTM05]|uniref:Tyrosine-type recombinase/integrase n=1 Tax=Streptantibioticus parmotrematis TaxID=2873249 RepID=A0ABS7QVS0_9ACTN|nr:tyrosine-type recombinase/integrase [Streptantibioticus parmotrematis]MBY8887289.1 tyrosine-type recombinase/integrase [Streptantibioticus parmotrematis]